MPKAPRAIELYMTSALHVVNAADSVAEVSARMRRHGVRHMPVLQGKKVVGVVSLRDLQVVEVLRDIDPTELTVERVMAGDPYVVDPEDDVARVAAHMAEQRIGSAVVAHGDQLKGLFTTTDALRALAAVLRAQDAVT
jgi:acetoin utilization protein AcuB